MTTRLRTPTAPVAALAARCAARRLRRRPAYQRPSAPTPAAFKEAPQALAGCRPRRPTRSSAAPWWTLFERPGLDALAAQVEVVEPERRRRGGALCAGAGAGARAARALFPTVGARRRARARIGGGARPARRRRNSLPRSARRRAGSPTCGAALRARRRERAAPARRPAPPISPRRACRRRASWRPTTSRCARPTPQLALLATTIEGYERALQITQNRYDAGIVAATDVLQAADPAANAQADLAALQRQRAQLRACDRGAGRQGAGRLHAAAGADGRRACRRCRSACRRRCCSAGPTSPRPSARVAAANAQIGIARVGLLPELRLSGSLGIGAAARRRPVQRLERALVARPVGGADAVRRRRHAAPASTRRRGRARRGGRALPADGADRLPGRRRPAQRRARAGRAGRRCAGRRRTPPTRSSSRC